MTSLGAALPWRTDALKFALDALQLAFDTLARVVGRLAPPVLGCPLGFFGDGGDSILRARFHRLAFRREKPTDVVTARSRFANDLVDRNFRECLANVCAASA